MVGQVGTINRPKMKKEGEKNATLQGVKLMWAHLARPNEKSDNPKYEVELNNLSAEHLKQLKGLDPSYTPNDGSKKFDREGNPKTEKGFYCSPKSNRPVPVFDSIPKPMHVSHIEKIGNGSVANVKVHSYAFDRGSNKGIALGLDEVQIVEYVEYDSGAGSFEAVKGGFQAPPVEDDVPM